MLCILHAAVVPGLHTKVIRMAARKLDVLFREFAFAFLDCFACILPQLKTSLLRLHCSPECKFNRGINQSTGMLILLFPCPHTLKPAMLHDHIHTENDQICHFVALVARLHRNQTFACQPAAYLTSAASSEREDCAVSSLSNYKIDEKGARPSAQGTISDDNQTSLRTERP